MLDLHVLHDCLPWLTCLIHIWHGSLTCVTWRIHMCDMPQLYVWHDSFTCVTRLIRIHTQLTAMPLGPWLVCMCDTPHSHAWHASFICVASLVYMCDMTHISRVPYTRVRHASFTCATWPIHTCDKILSRAWRHSFIETKNTGNAVIGIRRTCATWRVPCLIHMGDMTHSYVWHDPFICVTWRIHMSDMTHSYARRDSFKCVMPHPHVCYDSFTRVPCLIHTCDTTNSHVWQNPFRCVTRLIRIWGIPLKCMTVLIHISKPLTKQRHWNSERCLIPRWRQD